jgi:hypothetical protein
MLRLTSSSSVQIAQHKNWNAASSEAAFFVYHHEEIKGIEELFLCCFLKNRICMLQKNDQRLQKYDKSVKICVFFCENLRELLFQLKMTY